MLYREGLRAEAAIAENTEEKIILAESTEAKLFKRKRKMTTEDRKRLAVKCLQRKADP